MPRTKKERIPEKFFGIDITDGVIPKDWKDKEQEYLDLNNKKECIGINPNCMRINTMTLVTYIDNCNIDLEKLMEYLNNVAPNSASFPKKRSSKKVESKVAGRQFYNSVSWKIAVKDTINREQKIFKLSAMFFPNGRIKFAGCKSIKSCALIPSIVLKFLLDNTEDVISKESVIRSSGIEMINSDYHVFNKDTKNLVEQTNLKQIIYETYLFKNSGQIKSADYDPDKYPAVNIKFRPLDSTESDRDITICVFNSGSVIITGKKSLKDIKEGYDYINDILSNSSLIYKRPDFQKVNNRLDKPVILEEHFTCLFSC